MRDNKQTPFGRGNAARLFLLVALAFAACGGPAQHHR
jgi:hypothetical protein